MVDLATLALLLARGCPYECLDDAHHWLQGRKLPDTAVEALAEADEAIAVARSIAGQ